MNTKFIEAREHIARAREALRRGDKGSARQLGERAALLAPDMEDAWLVLAASDPNPHNALSYARKALELKPDSMRARRGVEWASSRVKQVRNEYALIKTEENNRKATSKNRSNRVYREAISLTQLQTNGRNWLYPALLIAAGCIVVGLAALFALTSSPLASIVSNISVPIARQENLWASVEIPKPTITPIDVSAFAPLGEDTSARAPSDAPTSVPTNMPTWVPTEVPTIISEPTETPGTMAMEIVSDVPTSQYVTPAVGSEQPLYPAEGNGERWIDVNLSEQRVYAYEGDIVVSSFVVSTGVAQTPTVTGNYKIYVRVRVQDMSGPGYYLTDVPYVMFFYGDYGFHGTYWHNNFGTPMSRGCVNLTIPDSEWLYSWASVGTVVNVHY